MDFTRADVGHLLRRAGFGATTAEIDTLMRQASWADVVDRVLDTSANPPDTIPAAVDDEATKYYGAWVAAVQYWVDRMVTTPTPIVEKMALFWHGLFTSSVDKVLARIVFRQVKTYRALGLGDLHDLVQAMATSGAMLQYLDGESNVKGNPNENFARELMELFLLGQGQYTESDVQAMARAWTGHGFDNVGETYIWYPGRHDDGDKTLFGITRNWDGPAALTEIVRGSKQQACARWIAGKLWAFMAGPAPTTECLDALVAAFVGSGMDLKALLRTIFLRPEFRSPAVVTGLLRSPVEWIASSMRALDLRSADVHPEWYVERCGQKLYAPPNVGGWRANDGYVSTSTVWGKGTFASGVQWTARDKGVFRGWGDTKTPAQAAAGAFERFGIHDPTPTTRAAVEAYVGGEQRARRSWAVDPSLVVLMMMSPEQQAA